MMVRAAVLKMKDPRQIIRDMEKLDEMGKSDLGFTRCNEYVLWPLVFIEIYSH